MKGYKATDKDMKCRHYQYRLDKEHMFDRDLVLCNSGLHFCKELIDVFSFYDNQPDHRFFEVEIPDDAEVIEFAGYNSKCVTNKIKFIRELSYEEIAEKTNRRIETVTINDNCIFYKGYRVSRYMNKHGDLHREDGPALIVYDRSETTIEYYYWNGSVHREDGPALVYKTNDGVFLQEKYFVNDVLHREDGPAVIRRTPSGVILEEHFYKHGTLLQEINQVKL